MVSRIYATSNYRKEKLEAAGDNETFAYMKRKKGDEGVISASSLEIVPFSEISRSRDTEAFTISLRGITRISGGSAEFTSLGQWKKEISFSDKLSEVEFFRSFPYTTAFRQWKSSIMKMKFSRKKKMLSSQYGFSQNITTLKLQIAELLDNVQAIELDFLDLTQSLTTDDFKDNFAGKLDAFAETIGNIYDQIIENLDTVSKQTENVISTRLSKEKEKEKQLYRKTIREPKKNFAHITEINREYRKISSIVKLVDLWLGDSLVDTVNRIVEYIDNAFSSFGGTDELLFVKPPFVVDVVLAREEISCSPGKDDLYELLLQLIELCCRKMSFPRLQASEIFSRYFRATIVPDVRGVNKSPFPSQREVFSLVKETEVYKRRTANIESCLSKQFDASLADAAKYGDLIASREGIDVKESYDIGELEKNLIFLNDQSQKVFDMPEYLKCGLFKLNLDSLKQQLLPTIQRSIIQISLRLPELLSESCEKLTKLIGSLKERANSELNNNEAYLAFLKFVDSIDSEMLLLKDKYAFTSSLKSIIDRHHVETAPTIMVNFQLLSTDYEELKQIAVASKDRFKDVVDTLSKNVSSGVEEYNSKLNQLGVDISSETILKFDEDAESMKNDLGERLNDCKILLEVGKNLCGYQEYLGMTKLSLDDGMEVLRDIEMKQGVWNDVVSWQQFVRKAETTRMSDISIAELEDQEGILKTNMRKYSAHDLTGTVIITLKGYIEELGTLIPFVESFLNPNLRERHWEDIGKLTGIEVASRDALTLQELMKLDIEEAQNDLSEIVSRAASESSIERILAQTQEQWVDLDFATTNVELQSDVLLVKNFDDVILLLDESMVTVSTVRSSKYSTPVKSEADEFYENLKLTAECIDEWIELQKKWLYLESIFAYPDIQRQLPMETKIFFSADRAFRGLCRRLAGDPNVIRFSTSDGFLNTLQSCITNLEKVEKGLEDCLDIKRLIFSRFCFLSNEELIEILSESRNPIAVQPHLNKCFENIHRLEFKREGRMHSILGMKSVEGEYVCFKKPLVPRGSAETWLQNVESAMISIIKEKFRQAIEIFPVVANLRDFLFSFPAQVVIGVFQIFWTRSIQLSLSSSDPHGGLREYQQRLSQTIDELVGIVKGDLTKLQRGLVTAIMTIAVHARDVLDHLVELGVESADTFQWKKNLRYYWDEEQDGCIVVQNNGTIAYSYEYLGCSQRLVITPLTDRCYVTLTEAMRFKLGGSPSGPAGTGKTETVKDLAKAIAKQCIVYNCNEAVNVKTMASFFSGICQSGAWICFDEFNRIDIEVLSVIAQQIVTIRNALSAGRTDLVFEGKHIRLESTLGYFITMNPGYAGRTELPDNLKALFRPVSMMVPDYSLIAEIILFSEGFRSARKLSRKMTQLYQLSSEQLSKQSHYDFGLRALKSILVMAGALKRSSPDLDEDVVLIRAMRDANLPKFVKRDIGVFVGLISDLFPRVQVDDILHDVLEARVSDVMESRGLDANASILRKTLQLYATLNIRHGVMLVGPCGSGKTTTHELLSEAEDSLAAEGVRGFSKIKKYLLNPKSISIQELYGEYNETTHEWRDGIITVIARKCVADISTDEKWIVFDGPVDALWIENMNSVLDDNKLLCLGNGERIKLTASIRMIFEVEDLAVASPATVSRCGMIYLDRSDLLWSSPFASWIRSFEKVLPQYKQTIVELFETHVQSALDFSRKRELRMDIIPTSDVNVVSTLCSLFEAIATPVAGELLKAPEEETRKLLSMIFAYSLAWSIGGVMLTENRTKFAEYLHQALSETCVLPENRIFDSFVDIPQRRWISWDEMVKPVSFPKDTPFSNMIVPTTDLLRYVHVSHVLGRSSKPVLFVGPSGVGKTVFLQRSLQMMSRQEDFHTHSITFSAQTTSARLQQQIEGLLERKAKNRLAPPSGKKLILMIDDVNMPLREEYGAQQPIELLRFLMTYGSLYDRKKLFLKYIENVVLFAACGPPGGGRNVMTERFSERFSVFYLPEPSWDNLKHIYGSILRCALEGDTDDPGTVISDNGRRVVQLVGDLYYWLREEMLPTPEKIHYSFTARELGRVFEGVLQVPTLKSTSGDVFARLVAHEMMRVFHDRLITREDREYFVTKLEALTKASGLGYDGDPDSLIFCSRVAGGRIQDYGEMTTSELSDEVLEHVAAQSTRGSATAGLVVFSDFVKHYSRVQRVLQQRLGHVLLLGVSGVGKQSVTRLVAKSLGYEFSTLNIQKGYGISEFKDDVRSMYTTCAVKSKPLVFFLGEGSILDERFLEDVNALLSSGEVPDLYDDADLETALGEFQTLNPSVKGDRSEVLASFFGHAKSNLHVVLGMDASGERFRTRCQQFPYLVNCCTIDFFADWTSDALLSVAKAKMSSMSAVEGESQGEALTKLIEGLSGAICDIHSSMSGHNTKFFKETGRRNYTTPSSFLSFVDLFGELLKERRTEIQENITRMKNGIDRLLQTNDTVEEMQQGLRELQPVLAEKAKSTDEIIQQLAREEKKVAEVKAVVQAEELEVNRQAEDANAIAEDARKDLDVVLPILAEAVESLNSLNKSDITEVKSFKTPPELVRTVLESVCVLKQIKPDWDSAKKMLGDQQFLASLKSFDKDSLSDSMIRKLKRYAENPNFNPELVSKVSIAATSLCKWVLAMYNYHCVSKVVAPKKERLRKAQEALEVAQGVLKQKQDSLRKIEGELAVLNDKLETSLKEKSDLEEKTAKTSERLANARLLTTALSEEQVRWKDSVVELNEQLSAVYRDSLLASAFISYLGMFNSDYRARITTEWRKIISTSLNSGEEVRSSSGSGKIAQQLVGRATIRGWESAGLPSDPMSVENALLTLRGRNWPLIVDPQFQATRWIRNMDEENSLKIIRMSDENFLRTVENSMRIGTPVLIEDVGENIDPSLLQILVSKWALGRQAGASSAEGDSSGVCDPNFKVYMATRLPNPRFRPDVYMIFTLVNFTVTPKALSDQILSQVVKVERPDLEEQRTTLALSIAREEQLLSDIERKVLKSISEAQGSILDNTVLIRHLNEAKETARRAKQKLIDAETAEIEITELRERYRSVATVGSSTYFTMISLSSLSGVYLFSLTFFNKLLSHALSSVEAIDDIDGRLKAYINSILSTVYKSTSRGLFERDKQIFAFLLAIQQTQLLPWEVFFNQRELIGEKVKETAEKSPAASSIDIQTLALCMAAPNLKALLPAMENEPSTWMEWLDDPEFAEGTSPPFDSGSGEMRSLSLFEQLCIARSARPTAVVPLIKRYIEEELGKEFVSGGMDLRGAFASTSPDIPLIFILTAGADPAPHIMKLAEERGWGGRVRIISLGQGQGPVAAEHIRQSSKNGDWVVLQNCHLATSWMPQLEQLVDQIQMQHSRGGVSDGFRLFLTTMPTESFPQTVLQGSMKLTIEPAKGIKANLISLLNSQGAEGAEYGNLHFSLTFMHTLLQERKKFGALGWNKQYEFNEGDLAVSLLHLREFLAQKAVDWEALRYVIGEINYGGRVTDDIDRRLLNTITNKMICTSALQPDYSFGSQSTYKTIKSPSMETFESYAAGLPAFDDPDVFGLHRNVDDAYLISEGADVIMGTLSCRDTAMAASGTGSGADMDKLKSKLRELESLIPSDVPTPESSGGTGDSLDIVLYQEIEKYNALLAVMRTSLAVAIRAIDGYVVMNTEIEKFISEISANEVPGKWTVAAFLSTKKLDPWIDDLQQRMSFIRNWRERGHPNVFWFPAFFFPQGFLIAVMQNYSRRHLVSIDSLSFRFGLLDGDAPASIEEAFTGDRGAPDNGALVYGIELEGARWSKEKRLLLDAEDGKTRYPLPVIHLEPVPETERGIVDSLFACPMYRTNERAGVLSTTGHSTNYVMDLLLPTAEQSSFWILRGVAALIGS